MRECVRFFPAIEQIIQDGYRVFIELGPHPVLSSSIRRTLHAKEIEGLVLSSIRKEESEWMSLFQSLGRLYECGYAIDWKAVGNHRGNQVSLPTYAWNHQTYWQDRLETAVVERRQSKTHPFLQRRVPLSAIRGFSLWEMDLTVSSFSWLQDHQVQGTVIVPASAMVEMALAAANEWRGEQQRRMSEFSIVKPLFLSQDVRRVQITLREDIGGLLFEITSCLKGEEESDGAWTVHATGKVS
jgi:polyketide synthase 12/epothilone polyketide synthase D